MTTTRTEIRARTFAAVGWAAAVVGATGAIGLRIVDPAPVLPTPFGFGDTALAGMVAMGVSFASVGALLVSRRPANAVGWIMVVIGTGYAVGGFAIAATFSAAAIGTAAGDRLAGVTGWLAMMFTTVGALILVLPFIFPTGRAQNERWRRLIRVSAPFWVLVAVSFAVQPGALHIFSTITNPFGIGPDLRAVTGFSFSELISGSAIALPPILIWSLTSRYRSSTSVERRQLKWFLLASMGTGVSVSLATANALVSREPPGETGLAIFGWAGSLIPVAIGIAILRHRLYDIDRLVNRTVAYGIVTGILAVTFFVAFTLLSAALASYGEASTIAVAASTLIAFAMVQPVIRWARRVVDRRFDRSRYDAERTVTAFSNRLRHEVDIATVAGDLIVTTRATVAPIALALWVRPRRRDP